MLCDMGGVCMGVWVGLTKARSEKKMDSTVGSVGSDWFLALTGFV
jgi:hypothetical protein